MKYIENELDEPRRVPVDGVLRRVPPHSIVTLPDDADISGIEGLSEVSEDDYRERQSPMSSERTPDHERDAISAASRAHANAVSVSAPLQVVVGDDDAPFGPPTGTISTKQLEAAKSEEAKRQFADHEQIEVPETASEIEARQAEKVAAVEEIVQEGIKDGTPIDPADDDEYSSLRGKDLNSRLEAAGLSTDGTLSEKQARLRDHESQSQEQ